MAFAPFGFSPGPHRRILIAPPSLARAVYGLLRPLLFRLDPERAHRLGIWHLARIHASAAKQARVARRHPPPDARLAMEALGLAFPGPLGVAAGFDKGAEVYNALTAYGFSHVEVGTVTPEPQEGNPTPRIERYPSHHALVNRLGFNNPGVATAAERLAEHPPQGIVGVNVGRNKTTPPEQAIEDYETAATGLAGPADYVTVNISSPNTPGLRDMQTPDGAAELVGRVIEALDDAGHPHPVLLKLHPDAPAEELVAVAEGAVDAGAAGIIAVNTTTWRPPGLQHAGQGGLSGQPLKQQATQVLARLHQAIGDQVPLIGVGGIETGQDAIKRVQAGATILQAYTGYVYRGPSFAQLVHQEMLEELDELGVDRLAEIVGDGAG